MALPLFHTDSKDLNMVQAKWKSALDPLLGNPTSNTLILPNVKLTTGSNVVNTLLGRKLQGWQIVRQRSAASIYDLQDSNQTPALTLVLHSSADVVVDLVVF